MKSLRTATMRARQLDIQWSEPEPFALVVQKATDGEQQTVEKPNINPMKTDIDQLARWLEAQSNCPVEIDGTEACVCERRSAGDSSPPASLMRKMRDLAKAAETQFSNVTATVEAVDEWADLRIQIL